MAPGKPPGLTPELLADLRLTLVERKRALSRTVCRRLGLVSLEGRPHPAWKEEPELTTPPEVAAPALIELDRLEQIHHALERIDAGSYGACTRCARPIPPLELRSDPLVTTCRACRERRSR